MKQYLIEDCVDVIRKAQRKAIKEFNKNNAPQHAINGQLESYFDYQVDGYDAQKGFPSIDTLERDLAYDIKGTIKLMKEGRITIQGFSVLIWGDVDTWDNRKAYKEDMCSEYGSRESNAYPCDWEQGEIKVATLTKEQVIKEIASL